MAITRRSALGVLAAAPSLILPRKFAAQDTIPEWANQLAARQGERSAQVFRTVLAHAVDLPAWQTLQAFGIFKASVVDGVTK